MIRLNDLIRNIGVVSITGEEDPVIENIEFDSRKVTPGHSLRGSKGY